MVTKGEITLKKSLGILLTIVFLSVLSFTLVSANSNNIKGLEIEYERAFVHDINGVSVELNVTNKTGKKVKIIEGDLIANVEGFEILKSDYYQFNGKALKNNKSKENWLLMYFDKRANATELEWVQPTFKVIIDGETHEIKGEKMYVE
jgi:hypothetical protein